MYTCLQYKTRKCTKIDHNCVFVTRKRTPNRDIAYPKVRRIPVGPMYGVNPPPRPAAGNRPWRLSGVAFIVS